MRRSWDIADIRAINPLLDGQRSSQIDHLISIAATNDDLLCSLAEYHELLQMPCALCILQLCLPLHNDGDTIVLPTTTHGVNIDAKIETTFLVCDDRGKLHLTGDREHETCHWRCQVTQVVCRIPVWGKRALYYDAYGSCITNRGVRNDVIVPGHESWIMDRALTAKDFEYNIVRRMLREVLYGVRILMRAIRVTTLYHCAHDYHFSGMFWMTYPGRITYTRPPRPIISEFLQKDSVKEPPVYLPNLENAIRHRHRDVSKFERSLISFETLRRSGEVKSALIGIVAVIESTLKERFSCKTATLAKVIRDERLSFLRQEDREVIDEMRIARNAVVHEYMSTELATGESYVTKEDRLALHSELDSLCVRGIEASRRIFRDLNLRART